jgi:hypothetical protein
MNFIHPSYAAIVIVKWQRSSIMEKKSGQGSEWINHGLPMYVAIDCKPENCCEIQNAACRQSGVMICLKIDKMATEAEALGASENDSGLLHGMKVLKELIQPWAFTNRMVCTDSSFALVGTAD